MSEIQGKVIAVLPPLKGNGKNGEWVKNAFVIEWQENGYKQNLCLEVMGLDKWEKMKQNAVVGNNVNVRYNVSSHEFNGRWFTSCQCFYCSSLYTGRQTVNNDPSHAVQSAPASQQGNDDDSLPF